MFTNLNQIFENLTKSKLFLVRNWKQDTQNSLDGVFTRLESHSHGGTPPHAVSNPQQPLTSEALPKTYHTRLTISKETNTAKANNDKFFYRGPLAYDQTLQQPYEETTSCVHPFSARNSFVESQASNNC